MRDLQTRGWLFRYGFALTCVLLAIVLRYALIPLIGLGYQYVTIFPAILVVAIVAGRNPAIFTAVIGSVIAEILFEPTLTFYAFSSAFIVIATGALTGHLVGRLQNAISQIRAQSEKLSQSEKRFRGTFENAAVAITHMDLEGNWLLVNERFCEMTGYSRDALLHTGFGVITHEDDIMVEWDKFRQLASGEIDLYWAEKRYVCKDGSRIWMNVYRSLQRDDAGKPLYIITVAIDITQRKEAEEALRKSELFYRQTLESIPGMVFTTRPDGYCDYQSQQWVDYTGVPMNEHLGQGWNKLLHPDDQPRALAAWQQAVKGDAAYDLEYRIRRHDSEYEWFRVMGRPIHDISGNIVRWFGVAVNINDLKHAQEKQTELGDKLTEKVKELESIISVVSHDLRAPLISIRGFNDIFKTDCQDISKLLAAVDIPTDIKSKLDKILNQSISEAVGYIDTSARSMNNLIESLVRVARAGLVVPNPQPLDMNHLVKDVVDSIRIKFRDSGATIDIQNLPQCFADKMHVTQIFTNLIDNAVKYLDPDRPGVICVDGIVEKGHALYWVSDNGMGIEEGEEQKVFDIFYRVSKRGRGEGIGLATVKRLIERNGGRVWAVCEKGKGCNFFVALPLEAPNAAALKHA